MRIEYGDFFIAVTPIGICLFLALSLLVTGCSLKPVAHTELSNTVLTSQNPVGFKTVSANIRLSFVAAEKHGSVRGMLVYRAPDVLRIVILNPFGTTVMDILAQHELLTIVYPGNSVGFQGTASELPPGVERELWFGVRWMLKPVVGNLSEGLHGSHGSADEESVAIRNGVVAAKYRSTGEQIRFEEYALYDGVLFAQKMEYETPDKNRVTIVFEDVELNQPIADTAFIPNLKSIRLLPLSAFEGVKY